jgi:hypothetical protein
MSPTNCLRLRNLSERKRFTDALCSKWEQQEYRRRRRRKKKKKKKKK